MGSNVAAVGSIRYRSRPVASSWPRHLTMYEGELHMNVSSSKQQQPPWPFQFSYSIFVCADVDFSSPLLTSYPRMDSISTHGSVAPSTIPHGYGSCDVGPRHTDCRSLFRHGHHHPFIPQHQAAGPRTLPTFLVCPWFENQRQAAGYVPHAATFLDGILATGVCHVAVVSMPTISSSGASTPTLCTQTHLLL